MSRLKQRIKTIDVLIVGCGLAGLRAAQAASEKGVAVAIVAKGDGATPEIIGFNAPVAIDDSAKIFFDDILRGGVYLSNRILARIMAEEAEKAVKDLERIGMHFDTENGHYNLLQPLGCTYPRCVHYGNVTGLEARKRILKKIVDNGVVVLQDIMITHLFASEGKIFGGSGIDMKNGDFLAFCASAVILAAGGCGTLYPFTTYPFDISCDGYAMAYQIGA